MINNPILGRRLPWIISRHYVDICVDRLSITTETRLDLDEKDVTVRTRSIGSTDHFRCSKLFNIPDYSAQL
jgi:hypothetical protein